MAPLIFGSIAFLHNYTDSTQGNHLMPTSDIWNEGDKFWNLKKIRSSRRRIADPNILSIRFYGDVGVVSVTFPSLAFSP